MKKYTIIDIMDNRLLMFVCFLRPCLSTYFIKKKAVYRHFLQQAK